LHRNINHLISVHISLLYQHVKSQSNLIKKKEHAHDQYNMQRGNAVRAHRQLAVALQTPDLYYSLSELLSLPHTAMNP